MKLVVPFPTALKEKWSTDWTRVYLPSLQAIRPESTFVPWMWNPVEVSTLWVLVTSVPARVL